MLADPLGGINKDDINTPTGSEEIIHVERLSTPTSSSEDNPERQEMLWRPRTEHHTKVVRDAAKAQSGKHERAAWRARRLYQLFGLPTVIIPLAGSVAAQFLPEAAVSAMLLASGICAGINAFLNYGQKAQMHFEYSARWADLGSNVDFELAKGRADRTAADVFLERLRNLSAALRAAEPPV
jgi:hypothetical protein